jgi:hypothetical protein
MDMFFLFGKIFFYVGEIYYIRNIIMIYKFKYWIPILGAILFHFDYCIVHDINVGEKYPLFSLYHAISLMIFLQITFYLIILQCKIN